MDTVEWFKIVLSGQQSDQYRTEGVGEVAVTTDIHVISIDIHSMFFFF